MNPVEVDAKLEELSDLLEEQAKANYRLAIAGAEAEADYRAAVAVERLKVRDEHKGEKLTEATIDALVAGRAWSTTSPRGAQQSGTTPAPVLPTRIPVSSHRLRPAVGKVRDSETAGQAERIPRRTKELHRMQ